MSTTCWFGPELVTYQFSVSRALHGSRPPVAFADIQAGSGVQALMVR
ncbi:hypothetical protein Pd630_LPD12017 (plasmid) [Rhodococcus opacus PD630]|nr:hypothetical protein Pd630_LPD12017 [Rhodococcus opacus PD630]